MSKADSTVQVVDQLHVDNEAIRRSNVAQRNETRKKWRIEMNERLIELAGGETVLSPLTRLKNGEIEDAVTDFAENFRFTDRGLGLEFTDRERLCEFFRKSESYTQALLFRQIKF
jgi:hypothetical protein